MLIHTPDEFAKAIKQMRVEMSAGTDGNEVTGRRPSYDTWKACMQAHEDYR